MRASYHRLLYWLCALMLTASSCADTSSQPEESPGIEQYPGVKDLYQFVEFHRAKNRWPALGVGVIHKGRIVGLGMAGERMIGSGQWAELGDHFEVGSLAKSMTATVAAMVVEEGKIDWNTRIVDVFPEWQEVILPAYQEVTLEQLLGHRSGLDQWMNSNEQFSAWNRRHSKNSALEQRLLFGPAALKRQPRYTPGAEHYYCNDGYFVAGSMIERVSDSRFEDQVRKRLFEPLKLTSATLGCGSGDHTLTNVWGHEDGSFGRTIAIKPEVTEFGDPPFGSPGGFLYCSVPDLLKYVNFHIEGAIGRGLLLKSQSFDRLHTPLKGQNYALGWEVEIKRNSEGKVIERSMYHGGYTGRTRANMWFCPESQWGTVIVCNHGRGVGEEMSTVFYALLQEFEKLDHASGQ